MRVFNFHPSTPLRAGLSIFKTQAQSSAEEGIILVGALVTMVFFMVVTLAIIEFSTNHYANVRRSNVSLDALSVAEAGADYYMQQLNKPASTYSGTGGEYTFYSNSVQGKATYETSIANGSISDEKIITSTGRIYLPATAATPLVTRKLRVIIEKSTSAGYTVQTGPGGLILSNNVHIAAGPIYLGGKLTMSNNATIGSSTVPVDVYAEDVACPTSGGATYPVQCSSAPPYTITTGNNAHIYGDVYAKNGVDTASRVTGSIFSNPPHVDYPIIDHTTVTTAHGWTNRSDNGSSSCGGNWAANTHFTTSVVLGNNCKIAVNGDVWIDGTITLGNNGSLTTAAGLTVKPNIIIDGYSSTSSGSFLSGNNASLNANATGIGFQVLTYYSFNATGTGPSTCNPSCSTLTGSQLYQSISKPTITIGNNFSSARGTLFYARWTKVVLSNNTTVGQLMGQTITLANNGNIVFGSGSSSGGTVSWDVKYWEQLYK